MLKRNYMTRQFTVCIPKDVGEWFDALEHPEQVVQEALQAFLDDVYRFPTEKEQRGRIRPKIMFGLLSRKYTDNVKRTVEVPNDLLGSVDKAAWLQDPLELNTDLAAKQIITVALLDCYEAT